MEKEENLRPVLLEKLTKFSKKFREFKKLQKKIMDSFFVNSKIDQKLIDKHTKLKNIVSENIKSLYINQTRIDEIVEQLSKYSKRIYVY